MNKADIHIENHHAVYDHYESLVPDQRVAAFVFNVAQRMVEPAVQEEAGALEQIQEHFEQDGKIILAANHRSPLDPFSLASYVNRREALHPIIGDLFVPGKSTLFTERPYSFARSRVLDRMVAVPVFRRKDADVHRAGEQTYLSANDRLIRLMAKKANQGFNVVIFPEGTIVREDTESFRARSGLSRIAELLEEPERFRIVPLGIDYPAQQSKRRPNIAVGRPIKVMESAEATHAAAQGKIGQLVLLATSMSTAAE